MSLRDATLPREFIHSFIQPWRRDKSLQDKQSRIRTREYANARSRRSAAPHHGRLIFIFIFQAEKNSDDCLAAAALAALIVESRERSEVDDRGGNEITRRASGVIPLNEKRAYQRTYKRRGRH